MLLGIVKGSAVCTIKYPGLDGHKLLVVQPVNKKLEPLGGMQVAVDTVDAGPGDLCVMIRSREASLALHEPKAVPIDLAVVGIVDQLHLAAESDFDLVMKRGHNPYT